MDIDDIQDNFGNKYNKSMTEMIEYAESEGLISKTKAKKLKIKCK
ncbi:hypothetical protein OIU80_16375 [Flavobacterium sp. LS1R47]|uniref:Uncharacterized protein n=1 Tax=Flavobacterium frigoritolerans TaxID=2987686 RepID=A0A9X3HLZ2_9FLAO|nr:hypothetical protein [Flavobacterium frigoritolerans]MCV9933861.1 hypothetical protein [Flavobacterium frigoritolerans]